MVPICPSIRFICTGDRLDGRTSEIDYIKWRDEIRVLQASSTLATHPLLAGFRGRVCHIVLKTHRKPLPPRAGREASCGTLDSRARVRRGNGRRGTFTGVPRS